MHELTVLRWFRDNFISSEDIDYYYEVAPVIVEAIESDPKRGIVYNYIYDNVINTCVKAIEAGDYEFAYNRYKSSILEFEEEFARPALGKRLVQSLNKLA